MLEEHCWGLKRDGVTGEVVKAVVTIIEGIREAQFRVYGQI